MSEDVLAAIDSTLADVSLCFCGCKKALRATSPSPWFASEECQARWGARQLRSKSGIEKGLEQVEAAPPVLWVDVGTASWAPFVEMAAGPSAGADPATVDLRRRVQDGTAPTPGVDRVHDAFRAEVIRQGLREYSVDGVRYVLDDGRCTCPMLDVSTMAEPPGTSLVKGYDPGCPACPNPYAARPVDAALEPDSTDPQGMDGPASTPACASPQGAVTSDLRPAGLKSETGSRLSSASQRPDAGYAARPWWRRMLPGGKR